MGRKEVNKHKYLITKKKENVYLLSQQRRLIKSHFIIISKQRKEGYWYIRGLPQEKKMVTSHSKIHACKKYDKFR